MLCPRHMTPVCNKYDFSVRLRTFVRKVSKKTAGSAVLKTGTGRARDRNSASASRRALEDLFLTGRSGNLLVPGWVARKRPEIVREPAKAGYEIASHGVSHRLIYTQTPEASADRGRQIALREDSVHGVELEIVEQMAEPLHAAVKLEVV